MKLPKGYAWTDPVRGLFRTATGSGFVFNFRGRLDIACPNGDVRIERDEDGLLKAWKQILPGAKPGNGH